MLDYKCLAIFSSQTMEYFGFLTQKSPLSRSQNDHYCETFHAISRKVLASLVFRKKFWFQQEGLLDRTLTTAHPISPNQVGEGSGLLYAVIVTIPTSFFFTKNLGILSNFCENCRSNACPAKCNIVSCDIIILAIFGPLQYNIETRGNDSFATTGGAYKYEFLNHLADFDEICFIWHLHLIRLYDSNTFANIFSWNEI